ncbi:APC family permease [Streptomyces sp. WM6378]|uniref:APC family permease n=1 Tax=Streptomyces sp. WM6378 TaxID=1415557 RepID=UPI00099C7171|nr:APC family permease [Streptomyces sp. WM6378]
MDSAPRTGQSGLLQRTLTTPKIVFIVIAAAAPLAAMVFTVPLSFALGTGPGVPAMFAFAGLTLLCFTAGYSAISKELSSGSGFYSQIAHGLGRPPAVGAGLIAVISYNAVTVGVLGAFAYFTQSVAADHGLHLHWSVWAVVGLVFVGVLGYRDAELSARVLAVCMVCEIAVLLALDTSVLVDRGLSALPSASFSPDSALAPGIGVSVMFAFASFLGFESAGLYGEEAKDPGRSVPRATVIAVLVVASFYAFTSWVAVGAVGPARVRGEASQHLGDLFFGLSATYLGSEATTVMQLLLCTSLLASWLALHNAANRYMYALGVDGVLPRWLDRVHTRHGSVHRASLAQTVVSSAVVLVYAAAGLNPYVNMSTSMVGLGTLGVIVLQALASVAVLGYFRRRPRRWWRTVVAPVLATLGLAAATVLVVRNFAVLTGTSDPVVTSLPWILVAAGAVGVVRARHTRSASPSHYARLGRAQSVPDPAPEAPVTRAPADRSFRKTPAA